MNVCSRWIKTNSVILLNAGSLVGTTVITSALGFVYWWAAARHFLPETVGMASAFISTMTLLGTFCVMGMGTLLITELPRQRAKAQSLISTALLTVGVIGWVVGFLFALVAPLLSSEFAPLRANVINSAIFATGVSLTSITMVFDQALIGLLYGVRQLLRNTLFTLAKLIALLFACFLISDASGISIYTAWAVGNIISLAAIILPFLLRQKRTLRSYLPQWGILRKLGMAAVQHHLLNITLQFPAYVLPVLVTVLLSAKVNALFYVSWMIVNFVFYIPVALTMVLHATNSAQQTTLAARARTTIGISCSISILSAMMLQIGSQQLLGTFGSSYLQAIWPLRILVLAAFPLIAKNHFISISRIYDRLKQAMLIIAPGCIVELGAAIAGAHVYGLIGLSIGWVLATFIEAAFMLPTIYRAIWRDQRFSSSIPSTDPHQLSIDTFWLIDTMPLPVAKPRYEQVWLLNTTPLPAIGPGYMGGDQIWLKETLEISALQQSVKIPRNNQGENRKKGERENATRNDATARTYGHTTLLPFDGRD